MTEPASSRLRYSVHGLNVELGCQVPPILDAINQTIGEFTVGSFTDRFSPISGTIRPFDEREVLRCLSPTATRISHENDLVELYEQDERFWLIDDHWGLCEINVLKGQWRSWVLAAPSDDARCVVENAVLWPMAQLLRPRGLCMIPAAAVARDGWGALLLSSFSIEPELTALVRAGYRIIGQNWTALRDEDGRVGMLSMPGSLDRMTSRSSGMTYAPAIERVDLASEFCGSRCDQATCDAVMLISPGRRPLSHLRAITSTNAVGALRCAWPLPELHPHRRHGQLPARIAQRCRIFDVQLSRNPREMLALMEAARIHRPPVVPGVSVTIHRAKVPRIVA